MTSNRKKFLIKGVCLFSFVLLLLLVSKNFAWAEETGATSNMFNTFEQQLSSGGLVSQLQTYGKQLFLILLTAQITWSFIKLVIDGKFEMQALVSLVIREVIVASFFYFFVKEGVGLFTDIINGFKSTGLSLAGLGGDFSPLLVVTKGFELISNMWKSALDGLSWWGSKLVVAVQLLVPTVFIIYSFLQIAMVAAVTYIRALVSACILVYFLGFGGSEYTRDIAIAAIKTVFMQAIELFVVIVIVGIMNKVIPALASNMAASDAVSWFVKGLEIAFATFIMQGLISSLPSMVSGVITGAGQSSGGANAAMGQQMASLMAGAASMAGGMALTGAAAGTGAASSWGMGKLSNVASNMFGKSNEVTSGGSDKSSNLFADGGKDFVEFAKRQTGGGSSRGSFYDAAKSQVGKVADVAKVAGKATTGAVKGTGNFMQDFGSRLMKGESIGGALAGATGTSAKNLGYLAKGIFANKAPAEEDTGNSLEAGSINNNNNNKQGNYEEGYEGKPQEVDETNSSSAKTGVDHEVEGKTQEVETKQEVTTTTETVETKKEEIETSEPLTSQETHKNSGREEKKEE